MRLSLAGVLVFILMSPSVALSAVEFFVSPEGKDTNPGTRARPFASFERARDAVRALGAKCPVTVWLCGGTYYFDKTFELTAQDSGTKDSPVIYRAFKGERVLLTGGRKIRGFKPVRDAQVLARLDESCRDKVLQVDLQAQGITDFGRMRPRGFGRQIQPAGLELFFRDAPMTLARWPNGQWAIIGHVEDKHAGKFGYEGDRPTRWTKLDDVWLHGYWTYAWADSYEQVKSIDIENRQIETYPPHGIYGYSTGGRYCALNILEELDEPGEWYLDRDTGILYFLPPGPLEDDVFVSLLEQPIISLKDVNWVTFSNLTFEYTRGLAVEITGGSHNTVAGCVFRNIGTLAVSINGGIQNGVSSCDISETGEGAISLQGGDRITLTPCGNYVQNCIIHDFSRWVRTYRPAVSIGGVGCRVAHNLIYSAPHSAIILTGNDHVIEFNEIHHVCCETGDAGAFYMGRDWTQRGNVVRYNFFHNISKTHGLIGWTEVMAVYLDDWTSGTRVIGNIFYNAGRAAMIGGGRDNSIENNIFIGCDPAVHVDARGLGWAKNYFDGTINTLFERLDAVKGTQPPYSERYPQLAVILQDEPAVPKGNVIARNIVCGGRWIDLLDTDKYDTSVLDIRDNLINEDPGFINPAAGDFRLRDDSPAWRLGFKRIPFDKIGLYRDEYRTVLPKPVRPSIRN